MLRGSSRRRGSKGRRRSKDIVFRETKATTKQIGAESNLPLLRGAVSNASKMKRSAVARASEMGFAQSMKDQNKREGNNGEEWRTRDDDDDEDDERPTSKRKWAESRTQSRTRSWACKESWESHWD